MQIQIIPGRRSSQIPISVVGAVVVDDEGVVLVVLVLLLPLVLLWLLLLVPTITLLQEFKVDLCFTIFTQQLSWLFGLPCPVQSHHGHHHQEHHHHHDRHQG